MTHVHNDSPHTIHRYTCAPSGKCDQSYVYGCHESIFEFVRLCLVKSLAITFSFPAILGGVDTRVQLVTNMTNWDLIGTLKRNKCQ